MRKNLLPLILALIVSGSVFGKVTLPALLSDNMVLQQKTQVKIWGWSKPDAAIKISTSWGENQSATADKEGNWKVILNTPVASFNPQTIIVSDGEPVTINNILIGEVWLCSGQSNMEMTLKGMWSSGVMGANQAIAESGFYQDIRLFNVKQTSAIKPQKDCIGKWDVSSPPVVKSFSAIGYYYALELRKILNVPVGIICSSWGGTVIEAWMDTESQKNFTDVDLNLLNNEKLPVFEKPISLYNGMIASKLFGKRISLVPG
jgi:sialate O-acetylesterase